MKWKCDNGTCIQSDDGPFGSLSDCQKECITPTPPTPHKTYNWLIITGLVGMGIVLAIILLKKNITKK